MSKSKLSLRYKKFCSYAYLEVSKGELIKKSSHREEVDFHLMHNEFIKRAYDGIERSFLDERYPFVKLKGAWYVSLPKLYLYLFSARRIISTFSDEHMVALHEGIQNSQRLYDETREKYDQLVPSGCMTFEEFNREEVRMYEEYLTVQMNIFDVIDSS